MTSANEQLIGWQPNFLTGSPFRRKPSITVYGPSGCGKSTDMARALSKCLFFTTNAGTLRPYYSYIREAARATFDGARAEYLKARPGDVDNADQFGLAYAAAELGMQYPLYQVVKPADQPWWAWYTEARDWMRAVLNSGESPFDGFVHDEWSTVLNRVYGEMQQLAPQIPQLLSRAGKVDEFKIMDAMEDWLRDWIFLSRDTGCAAGFVCQEQSTKYYEDPLKLHYGEQKYPAGPQVPFGRLLNIQCYEPDVTLRVTLKSGMALPVPGKPPTLPGAPSAGAWVPKGLVARKYWTETSKEALAKFRDFAIAPEEILDLLGMLRRADYL